MKKLQFSIKVDEKVNQHKMNVLKTLNESEFIRAFCNQNQVDFSFIEKYSGRFYDYLKVQKQCGACKGLNYCQQAMQGQRLELYVDGGYLQHKMVKCPYQKQKDLDYAHKKYFKRYDFDEKNFMINIMDESLLFGEDEDYQSIVNEILLSLEEKKGIYLSGNVGVGKSYLAIGMCNYYSKLHQKTIAFVNVSRLMSDLKLYFDDEQMFTKLLTTIKKVDVLVLDDLGSEVISNWSRDEILFPLLDYRMNHEKKTIFTSNYTMDILANKYQNNNKSAVDLIAVNRLIERIRTLSKEVYIKGASRRK